MRPNYFQLLVTLAGLDAPMPVSGTVELLVCDDVQLVDTRSTDVNPVDSPYQPQSRAPVLRWGGGELMRARRSTEAR